MTSKTLWHMVMHDQAGAGAHQYCLLTNSPSLVSTRFSLSLMRFFVSATLERA